MTGNAELCLIVASVATAACTGTGIHWLSSIGKEMADRQISRQLDRARQLDLDPSSAVALNRIRLPAMVMIVVVFGFIFRNYAVAVAVIYLLWIAPVVVMDGLVRKRSQLLRDQMVEAAVTLANSVRASADLSNGLRRISLDAPEPLASEFRRIISDLDAGRVLRDVILDAQNRLNLDSFTLFAAAVLAADEAGGPLSATLDNIARSLQENQRLERKLEAQTESGRMVVSLLALAPLGFLAGSYFLFPEGAQLVFTTAIGQVVLLVTFALVVFAVHWSKRILATANA